MFHEPVARYEPLRVAQAQGMPGMPPQVSNPDLHHGTCVTQVPWCMPGSLTRDFEVGGGGKVPGIPGACVTRNFTYLVRGSWAAFPAPGDVLHRSAIIMIENVHCLYSRLSWHSPIGRQGCMLRATLQLIIRILRAMRLQALIFWCMC